MKRFLKRHWTTIILVLVMIAGLSLLLYPTFSDWWNSFHQSRAIASYDQTVQDMSEAEKKAMLEAAHAYNERLAQRGIHFVLTEEETAEYESILDITGTGIMGYIQIPSINVNLPIYHGTDEAILQIAIGHLAGSSLPVGGVNTHAVVSGHRGLPSAKLFTDLDQMTEGDIFTIRVLDETITYEVDQIRIVEPADVDDLDIISGGDYCTLVTCTPYGINSHRMLVRGHRTENRTGDVNGDAMQIQVILVALCMAVPLLLLWIIQMVIRGRRRVKLPDDLDKMDL